MVQYTILYTSAYLHRCVLQSHCLHSWNIRLCQKSLCNTLSFLNVWNRNLRTIVLPWDSLIVFLRWFIGLSESLRLGIFLQKLYRFFKKISSTSGRIWLRSRALKTLAVTIVRVMALILCGSRVTFLGEQKGASFCLFLYCILFIHSVA